MLDRPAVVPIVHSATGKSNARSAYEVLFDNTSAAEKERSELEEPDDDGSVEEPDDDGSVEEPSYNPGTPTKEHHSYNPGTPPKPVMPLVQKSQSIVDLRNATSGASRPADNQHVRLNKRIKLLGEETKENPRLPMPLQME
ncbi:hypothetical protein AeRB84_016903 [Aphanomyces euteiches]|nr:hypothetical protein AeRB84_016903 [Aphanomyces euteiches]